MNMADAPGAVVGTAVLQVIPSMKGGVKGLEKELNGGFSSMGANAGKQYQKGLKGSLKGVGGIMKNIVKGGLATVGVAGVAAIGTSLNSGFKRLDNIDKAQAKLKGLGHDQKNIDKIMKNSLEAVKGTAFGLDTAASASAGLVASGIKPGKELTDVLKLTADTATIAGVGMDEMGAIFNKVAAGDKLDMEVVNQLQDRGIPVLQALSKETGKSVGQVRKDLSAGKIDFDTFSGAMESTLGGAAQESGKTFSGAMANVKAAMGRLGASFLEPFFKAGPGILTAITGKLDLLGPAAEKAGKMVSGGLGKAVSFLKSGFAKIDFGAISDGFGKIKTGAIERIGPVLSKGMGAARKAFDFLLPHIKQFGSDMKALWPTVQSLAKSVGSFLGAAFKAVLPYVKSAAVILGVVFVGAMKVLPPILKTVMGGFKWLLDTIKPLLPLIASLTAMFITYKGVMAVGYLLQGVRAFMAMTRAQKLAALATKAQAAAQWALNLAMSANPIGVIIAIIIVLVGTLIYLYKNNETVRKGIDAAWAKIKGAFKATIDWFVKTAWPNLRDVFNAIVGSVKKIPGYFRSAGSGIKTAWSKVSEWVMAPIRWAGSWIGKSIDGWKLFFSRARDAIKVVWDKTKSIVTAPISWAAGWIRRSVAGWKLIFSKSRDAIKRVWDKTKSVIMTPVRGGIDWVKKKADQARSGFVVVRDKLNRAWARVKEMVMRPIRDGIDWVKRKANQAHTGFVSVRDRLNRGWARVKEMVMRPIRLGIDWVKKKADQARAVFINVRDRLSKGWSRVNEMVRAPIRKGIDWVKTKADQARAGFISVRDKIKTGWSRINEMVRAPIRRGIDWVKTKADQARTGFLSVRDKINTGWAKMNEYVRAPIRKGVDWAKDKMNQIKDKFVSIRDALGDVWGKLYDKIKSPFKKARTWINDKFIHGINGLLGKVGVNWDVPNISGKGWATGGYTGAGGKYTPAGVVHKDEFVLRKEATNRLRKTVGLGGLNYMNQTGQMPTAGGYASGGLVALGRRLQERGYQVSEHSLFGGNNPQYHMKNSLHNSDNALDINTAPGTSRGEMARLDVLSAWLKKAGWHVLWRVPDHFDHLHVDTKYGDKAAKGAMGTVGMASIDQTGESWFDNDVVGFVKKLKLQAGVERGMGAMLGKLSPGMIGSGLTMKMVSGAKNYLGKMVNGMRDKFVGLYDKANMNVGGIMDFASSAGVGQWRDEVEKALRITGQPLGYANRVLNQIRTESGGNPRAVNNWDSNARRGTPSKGLLQTIDPTYRAYAHPDYNKGVFDPMSNIIASIRYALARYGSLSRAYRGVGYSDGGLVEPLLFDSGGYLPTGVSLVHNKTGKPEPLGRMDTMGTGNVTVYVQSPWGPEYMESKVRDVVEDEQGYSSTLGRMN